MNPDFWQGKRVFLTGHTGFKGGWLSLLLERLGAVVTGYALAPATQPCLFELAHVAQGLKASHLADIRDTKALTAAMQQAEPEIVFHLAAQPLVRASYRDPSETWSTNVMGTVNVLEAVRNCPGVRAVLVVTTDKCYENREWVWGYREIDALGGYDPYSASKASAEHVVASYRRSFLAEKGVLIATARAGNVIGGGDWSEDRLIPDVVRAVANNEPLVIRNPLATRPWQHVLEAINGYMLLAERLLAGDESFAEAFNFGPGSEGNRTVQEVLSGLNKHWPRLSWHHDQSQQLHEAGFLFLDTSLARSRLKWAPCWEFDEGVAQTAYWYHQVLADPSSAREITLHQIQTYFG
ncbi:CDP-glucose 4,6-dehydratase [Dechloromonas sp. ZY10]|uniref:CDP-glucose 4,6-dehydratase n=1 Tax=Dechloromonas aquae TaxID=2664436 RepID=UPI0035274E6E